MSNISYNSLYNNLLIENIDILPHSNGVNGVIENIKLRTQINGIYFTTDPSMVYIKDIDTANAAIKDIFKVQQKNFSKGKPLFNSMSIVTNGVGFQVSFEINGIRFYSVNFKSEISGEEVAKQILRFQNQILYPLKMLNDNLEGFKL